MNETVTIILPKSGENLVIPLERKQIKTIRLKISSGLQVTLSAPARLPYGKIRGFAESKAGWVEQKLKGMKNKALAAPVYQDKITDGCRLMVLGNWVTVAFTTGTRRGAELSGGVLYLRLTAKDDEKEAARALDEWWKKSALEYFVREVSEWFPIVESAGVVMPQVSVRKMKSVWGSCHYKKGMIVFNHHLFSAPPGAVAYVVVHELTHFIHPNHGRGFHSFMQSTMPEYKSQRTALKSITPGGYMIMLPANEVPIGMKI